jgi:flagellar hook-associated protein 2
MSSITPSTSTTSSSSTPSYAANNPNIPTLNIGGLASGLDTNSIISELMSIEQIPQQQIIDQMTVEQARQTDLQTIQGQLTTFSNAISTLIEPSTWTTSQQVSSSDPSHVTATGTGVPPGGFQISVTQLARAQQLTQSTSLAAANAADTLTIQVGSSSAFNVSVSAGDSLQTIASKINSASNTQVYASVIDSKLVLASQVTGASNTMSVASSGTLASDLGLTQTVAAQDANFTVDGGATQSSASNIVTSIASGLNVTLLGITASPASVTVSTPAPNTDGITSAIQNFVTVYNQTIDMITSKLNEQRVINPQTVADKEKGDLEGNPTLISLLSQMRNAVSDIFSGQPSSMQSLSQIGISTGSAVGTGTISQSSLDGDLTVDTSALSSALTTNFTAVKQMFSNVTNTYSSEGLAQRLNGVVNRYIGTNGIVNTEIAGEGSIISELQTEKADWDVRLAQKEQALRAQFTQMEVAMSQSQSQSSWLSAQIYGATMPTSSSTTSSSTSSTSSSTHG